MAQTKAPDYEQLLYGKKPEEESLGTEWWTLDDKDVPKAIEGVLKSLYDAQARRQQQLIVSSRLYGNLNLMGLAGVSYSKVATMQTGQKDKITFNICSSTVDTITSKIAKNKPKPYFLTSGGDYRLKRKAEKLGKFIDGCFYENRMYELGVTCFRDAAVWGDGCVHVYAENGKIKAERQLISELYVDELEGIYGNPRQMYKVKNIDRKVLAAKFPEYKTEIMTATRAEPDGSSIKYISDQVTVTESWHLPSGIDEKTGKPTDDGKHVITIDNATLHSEPWTRDTFPFAFFKWNKRLYGFYGMGLVEQIQNIQLEVNKLLWVIQRSMHLAGSFKVLLQNGSKIASEKINNDVGAIINYTGAEPKYITPPIVPAEIYSHLTTLKNAAYEQAGISQLSAAAKKPDGLNSGRALREYNDIESDRFMVVGQAYEQFFLDIADLMIEEGREVYKVDKGFKVNVPGKKFIQTIKWKEVHMEDDQFSLQAFPVSKLPSDPAGRLQTIQEYMQSGLMSPQTGRRLLDDPDLEAEESLANAQEEYLHKILDGILDDKPYIGPEPDDDLQQAEKLALEYLARSKMEGVEEEKQVLFRMFLSQVQLLLLKASQPPAPGQPGGPQSAPQGGPGGAQPPSTPMANPMPAPQSDMLNNTPQAA